MAARPITDEQRARLRHVRVPAGNVDVSRFPDFLIVGPQRTGTTWLHAMLREHPEVFLSEPKEIFYFSRIKTPDHPKFQSDDLVWYLNFFRERPDHYLYKQAMALRRTFRPYLPRVRGEATASYAVIDADVIDDIVVLNPDVKVVMMVRDPVERAWSHAKKDLSRNRSRPLAEVSEEEFHAFFRDPYQLRCARYAECIDRWSSRLRPGHLLVGRFDDVETRPRALFQAACRFIGVSDEARYVPASVAEIVNPTAGSSVPEEHRRHLEALLADELESWRSRFGGP
ncbi:MAG: sulfotransferase [Myxococcales bacterium]|jgi:hypothetical protein|nr:MAG: sulfotransferase [Myxococcales bacterium]